jgi:hypothetical protein
MSKHNYDSDKLNSESQILMQNLIYLNNPRLYHHYPSTEVGGVSIALIKGVLEEILGTSIIAFIRAMTLGRPRGV